MNELDRISIKYIRVISTIMILLCHLVVTFDNVILQKSAQFLNVGVFIFLVISGYIFGKRDISNINGFEWFKSRFKRIQTPIYVFLFVLFLIYLAKGIKISYFNWFIYIIGLQGIELYLNGAEHLWYITIILVCYLITPILNNYKNKIDKNMIMRFYIFYLLLQIVVSYLVNKLFGVYLIHIGLYIIAYYVGFYMNSDSIKLEHGLASLLLIFISMVMRIAGLILFDGSILYDVFIVGYTHSLLALGIFFFVFYIVKRLKKYTVLRIFENIDRLSYEIYIVHYVFIVGPINIMVTDNNILNCIIVLLATYISSLLLNYLVKNVLIFKK